MIKITFEEYLNRNKHSYSIGSVSVKKNDCLSYVRIDEGIMINLKIKNDIFKYFAFKNSQVLYCINEHQKPTIPSIFSIDIFTF